MSVAHRLRPVLFISFTTSLSPSSRSCFISCQHTTNIQTSRQSLKKYVKANNELKVSSDAMFDSLFNKALKNGVDKGIFEQPKGPSGGTKLAKKAAKPAAPKEKKEAAPKKEKKETAPKEKKEKTEKAAPKKAAAPKKEKKEAAPKKEKKAPAAKKEKKEPAAKKAAAPKKEKKAAAPKEKKVRSHSSVISVENL